MGDKNDIISKAYNEFYGSVKETFTQARKQDKSITLADVQKWFDGNFVRKTNLRGSNSYIAQKPYEEYQIDLFFMPETDGEEYQQALIMIDTFSKFMTVVPLKLKQANEVLEAIKKGSKIWVRSLRLFIPTTRALSIPSKPRNLRKREHHPHDHQSSRTSRRESSSNDQEHALQADGSQAG
jgi:hypothetical protein